jgi:hypothetical protein
MIWRWFIRRICITLLMLCVSTHPVSHRNNFNLFLFDVSPVLSLYMPFPMYLGRSDRFLPADMAWNPSAAVRHRPF